MKNVYPLFLQLLSIPLILALECPKNDKCLCLSGTTEFEFQCDIGTSISIPFSRNIYPDIVMHIIEHEKVLIDCDSKLWGTVSITSLDPNFFPNITLSKLKYLKIRFCPLPKTGFKEILDHFGIKEIQFLQYGSYNLSSTTLTPDLFDGLSYLPSVQFNDANLEDLDDEVFRNFENLTSLDLQSNRVKLKPQVFRYTPKLKDLDLSQNGIVSLPENLFESLPKLEILHMWGNKLREINETTFLGLVNLKLLELSSNDIMTVSNDAFKSLRELAQINLSQNDISKMESDVFRYNKKLKVIWIKYNARLQLSDGIFSQLPHLEKVEVSNCMLTSLPNSMFANSPNLTNVSFAYNNIKELPVDLFDNLQKLERVNLENNKLITLGSNFKTYNIKKSLFLQNNELELIESNTFQALSEELDLSNNKIARIESRAFHNLVELKKIDLSRNQLVQESSDTAILENLIKLECVNISYNHITQIENVINMYNKVNLVTLDLSFNEITNITLVDLQPFSKKLTINLESNNITTVNFERIDEILRDVRDAFSGEDNSYSTIYLNNNPLQCNCFNYDLVRYYQNALKPQVKVKFDIKTDEVNCANPKELRNFPLETVPQKLLICSFEELDELNCIDECSCKYRPYDKSIIYDCSNRNLSSYPDIESSLSDVSVKHVQTEMHLEGNYLKQFGKNCSGYDNVTRLFLSYNKIERVTWLPSQLEVLHLDHNRIKKLEPRVLKDFNSSSLINLTLDHNPWICECGAENLTSLLREKVKIIDATEVLCFNSTTRLIDLNKSDICPALLPVHIALIVMAVALLFALLTVTYYRYQQPLKVWLYAHNLCLWWVTEEELDKDKIYDAFISYSHKDEDFVVENLLPVLEGGPKPYKLCIHYRNFIPGEFIATQVTNAVLESRRTLVVLSTNFLESIWGKMEFRTAHTQAMTEGRARVIIVLYGDLDLEKLDGELKAYLKTNTYVKWGDPYFWSKLRYALPHSRGTAVNNQKMANVMSCIDDRFKLVVPQTPNSGSTPPVLSVNGDLLKKFYTPPAEAGNLLV